MDIESLCKWLRENSSGIYRKSAYAAHLIEQLSAENARLQSVIDAANAQQPKWYIENATKEVFSPSEHNFLLSSGTFMPEECSPLYARPITAQQSPAVAVPENKKIDYWHMKYDELLTKTVTIFDENIVGFLEWYEKNYDAAGGLSADLVAKAWVDSRHLMAKSPRITEQDELEGWHTPTGVKDTDGYVCGDNYESGLWSRRNIEAFTADGNRVGGVTEQDAREIIEHFIGKYSITGYQNYIEGWMLHHCRALLNKLNAKPESVGFGTNRAFTYILQRGSK